MPFTAPVALFFLVAAVLGIAAFVRRSRRLAYMASGALVVGLVLAVLLVASVNQM